jgi:hypothetical protein
MTWMRVSPGPGSFLSPIHSPHPIPDNNHATADDRAGRDGQQASPVQARGQCYPWRLPRRGQGRASGRRWWTRRSHHPAPVAGARSKRQGFTGAGTFGFPCVRVCACACVCGICFPSVGGVRISQEWRVGRHLMLCSAVLCVVCPSPYYSQGSQTPSQPVSPWTARTARGLGPERGRDRSGGLERLSCTYSHVELCLVSSSLNPRTHTHTQKKQKENAMCVLWTDCIIDSNDLPLCFACLLASLLLLCFARFMCTTWAAAQYL